MVLAQVSNVCNSHCVHCWFSASPTLRQRDGVSFMNPDLLRKVVNEVADYRSPLPLLRITGAGEPFLMPGLVEVLSYGLVEKSIRAAVITNGSLLIPEKSEPLIAAGIEALEISADAADKHTYEKIRRGLKFEVLLRNVEHMLNYREKKRSKTKILVSFVENPDVIDPGEVEQFWSSRADTVIRRKYLTYGQISEELYCNETYLPAEERVPCPYPFERMVVLANGNVTFCNFDVEDGYYMGDVRGDSIANIWTGEKFEAWRSVVLARRFEEMPLCRKCNDWKYKSWTHNFFKVLRNADRPD